jgi:putative aminopeptidase FrvX
MKALIQKLVEATGPSGYESQVRNLVKAEVKSHADEISVDAMGNLIVRKGTLQKNGQKIMLSAHIDEIGVIVTHIDENGFLRFTNLGGVRAYNHIGGRVRFLDGRIGVIGVERMSGSDLPGLDKLFIDVGASSRKDCPVKVGDVAAFERPFTVLEVNGSTRLVSKAMDDRISVAVLIETLRGVKQTPHELYFVFSVQEEVGLRGATTAAFGIDADLGLAVDVTLTGDTPKGTKMEVSLGKGPAIKVRDGGMLSDPRIVDWMVRGATKAKLPYQLEVLEGGTTDARAMQVSRSGMPAGCVSIPCRYVHSPSEMVDLADVENAVRLLVELISKPVNLG